MDGDASRRRSSRGYGERQRGGRIWRPTRVRSGLVRGGGFGSRARGLGGGFGGGLGGRGGSTGPRGVESDDELRLGSLGTLDEFGLGCGSRVGAALPGTKTGNGGTGPLDGLVASGSGSLGSGGVDPGCCEVLGLEGRTGAGLKAGGVGGSDAGAGGSDVVIVRDILPALYGGDLGMGVKNTRLRTERAPEANSTT
jgi:hypothetical protein